jgi:hypothetical protein
MTTTLFDIVKEVDTHVNTKIESDGIKWIQDNISLPSSYSEPGPFTFENHGYLLLPMKSVLDPEKRISVIVKPAKTGGTLIADVALPYWIVNRPGPIQYTYQSDLQAKKHVKDKIYPLLKDVSGIMLPDQKFQTKDGIKFAHMDLYVGGPSRTNLQEKDISIAVADEVWDWAEGRLTWAYQRTLAYERKGNSKFVVISQAGELGSQLHKWYMDGSRHEHVVPCMSCSVDFAPSFKPETCIFDASSSHCKVEDDYIMSEISKTIRIKCPHCGYLHADTPELKAVWSNSTRYIQQNSSSMADYDSFHWTPFVVDDWAGIVAQFLSANRDFKESGNKDSDDLIVFNQSRLAEFTYPKGSRTPDGEIKLFTAAPESWGKDVALRLMSIDIQSVQGVYWVGVREFKKNCDGQLLWYGQLVTEADLLDIQKRYEIPPKCVLIDVGDSPSTIAYPMLARNGWIGMKGDGQHDSYKLVDKSKSQFDSYISSFRKLVIDGVDIHWLFFAKQSIGDITNRFLRKKTKVSWISLPNKEYEKQIRRVRREEKDYNRVKRWVWVDDAAAHAWDIENQFVAGCFLHRDKVDIFQAVQQYVAKQQSTGQYISRTNLPSKLVFDDTW